jgi:hypothetical protein
MARLSATLRNFTGGIMHWCPGCDCAHGIWIEQPNPATGARWTWNGDAEKPTVSPSILCFTEADGVRRTLCHYFIRNGNIEFCADSPHALKGQTVPLPPFPH